MNKYKTGLCAGILCMLFSCCTEELTDSKNGLTNGQGIVQFTIEPLTAIIDESPLSRSVITNSDDIKHVWCAIQDTKGNTIRTFHLSGINTKKLHLEGIEPGGYTAYFMATTEEISPDTTVPEDITQPWISHSEPGQPFEKDYLFKKMDFTVSPDQANQKLEVKLPRLTGRTEVNLNFTNSQIEQLVQKVEIIFDEEAKVSNFMSGNGTYGGENSLAPINITKDRGFFSLPGTELSGVVRITQKRDINSSETSSMDYHFDHFNIVPGFISTIQINYSSGEESYGEIKVNESSYTAENSTTMFMDSEPVSVILTREFKVKEPLHISIDTSNKKLVARFYSPLDVRDTKVWIKFKRYSKKFFLLAHYDIIHPFQESKMDIPIMSNRCKFMAEDGEQVWIPAQEDLSMGNCELKVTFSDTPYMQKIQAFKCNWKIRFREATADPELQMQIEDMTPEIARHICVLGINLAYMFSSDYFQAELDKLNGLYDDFKRPVDKVSLMKDLFNKERFELGILERNIIAVGLGGGNKIAMLKEYYTTFLKYNDEPARVVFFHEVGHCLGYGHDSNMTDDNFSNSLWPYFCSNIFNKLRLDRELPICDDIVSDLPR